MTYEIPSKPHRHELLKSMLCVISFILLIASIDPSLANETGAPIPPEKFSDDYFKVYGTPNITLSLERTNVYQGEQTSLFLTLTNRGRITSFQVNEEPGANKREEILAAEREQELEKLRTVAQDVSVQLAAENLSAIDILRSVAFPGSIREGQTSVRLEYPLDVYKNAKPGFYHLLAQVNYTYQRDVAVKGDEDHPESPDIFYWYDSLSQTIPITLKVERRSGAEFSIRGISPNNLKAGSKDNVIKITIKNVGNDTARDLVARLRPESGIYVSVDESPIPIMAPGDEAELIFKLDVSKDAVSGKKYLLKTLFEFSDSHRDDLTDSENAYIAIERQGTNLLIIILPLLAVVAVVLIVIVKKRRQEMQQ
jgi:hypothetical protein